MAYLTESKELNDSINGAKSVEDIRLAAQNVAAAQGHRTARDAEGRFAKRPPETVSLTETEKLNDALSRAANAEEVKALLYQAAIAQGVAVPDQYDPMQLVPTGRAAQVEPESHTFSKTEVIGGKSMKFEAATEADLTRQITDAYRVAERLQQSSAPSLRAVEQVAGVAEPVDDITRADLELKFRLGQITAEEFIVASGAVGNYLAQRGVDVNGLRDVVDHDRANVQVKSWEAATQEFLSSSDWPGGQKNLEIIGMKLQEMGLAYAEDKVAALAEAYAEMKRTGVVFPPEEQPYDRQAAMAMTQDLTPQALLELWRQNAGSTPDEANDAFVRSFSATHSGSSLFGSR